MWIRTRAPIILAVALLADLGCGGANPFSGADGADAEYTEHLERALDGVSASTLDAQTTNGGITLNGTGQGQVVVRIRKTVRAPSEQEAEGFARKVQIHVERNGNGIWIYKHHPKPPNHTQVEVEYDIQCPSSVDVVLATVNGVIQVRGMQGTVDAGTVNGNIDLQGGAGNLSLRCVNGNVDALAEALRGAGWFSTVNGSVTLTLPAGFSGQLDAQTTNGRASSDFPIAVPAGSPRGRLSGPLGDGGSTQVTLRAVNGNVSLKRRQ